MYGLVMQVVVFHCANVSMVVGKLKTLEYKLEPFDKVLIIFDGYWNLKTRVKLSFLKEVPVSQKTQEASYSVIELIAQKNKNKNHVHGEKLIMPQHT